MKFCSLLGALVLLYCLTTLTFAQPADSLTNRMEMLRVYLDCDYCDYQYLMQNILFVDFVRDPYVSQVHIIISTEHTAAGGHKFSVRFIGREKFSGMEHTLFYHSIVSESEDQQRKGLTQLIKMGLMPYLSQTALLPAIDISFIRPTRGSFSTKLDDRWDQWIFRLELGGGMEAEEQRNSFKIKSNIRANRITEQWRIGVRLNYEYEEEIFKEDGGERVESILEEKQFDTEVVKSLSNHWSAGIFNEVISTTYRNIDLGITLSSAVQYNIFPWKESAQRILAVSYHLGIRSFRYLEETLYNKFDENRFYESLALQWEMIQSWGEVYLQLEGSHYLQDFSKNRIILDTHVALRLIRGFSLVVNAEIESIHDQIYLAKGEATLQEILLKRKQLSTTFNYAAYFTMRYTFGSIFSNIVNRRLSRN